MHKGRLEAFSDGVIAIIITIMVLEMKVPHGESWSDLLPLLPVFVSYVLSFANVGIYWNNHHHLLQLAKKIDGRVLWANLHLLFWLSLIPFVTGWMGENHFAPIPVALYGIDLLMCGVAYYFLAHALLGVKGQDPALATALGRDFKGRISVIVYVVAIAASFFMAEISMALYVGVALMWFIPDRRIERVVSD